MTIMDIARTEVVTAGLTETVQELARIMADERVGSVVIVDDERVPRGIVTDRDLAVIVCLEGRDPITTLAEEVMAPELFTVPSDAGIVETITMLAEASIRRAPVVDADELVGIVTMDDLVVLLTEELAALSTVIGAESPRRVVVD